MHPAKPKAEILLIDDDRQLGAMLEDFFAQDQLALAVSGSGEDGLRRLGESRFDLVILDIMLPGKSGLEVLQRVRRDSNVPVIMLTARGDDVDRIIGLEFGADDYIAKPFNPRELVARIRAILRRSARGAAEPHRLAAGELTLDLRKRLGAIGERPIRLTGTEFEILRCLLEKPGEVVNKEHLSERALGRRLLPYDRSIDTHISNLRGKIEPGGITIRNQRGIGYLLIPGEGSA